MSTLFQINDISLTLNRYPATSNANLQAWDAADEYLLQYVDETSAQQPIMVLNDNFGALLCSLKALFPTCQVAWLSDAKTSHLGAQQNLSDNTLNQDAIEWLAPSNTASQRPELVLMKLPKNLNYFIEQLTSMSQWLSAGTKVLVGAKAKNINQALLKTIESNFGPASASLAWKKTRVITATFDGKKRTTPVPQQWKTDSNIQLVGLANVFAATKLDIGARLMMSHYPEGHFKEVIDLGCGNGILGIQAATHYPTAKIHFIDDSYEAIESAQLGVNANQVPLERVDFHWDDCLTNLDEAIAPDLILCNPPFHQGEAITDHIAWQMFMDAKKRLIDGGMLQIVGNRHLGYHVKLKRLFGNCSTVASNQKFVILRSIK